MLFVTLPALTAHDGDAAKLLDESVWRSQAERIRFDVSYRVKHSVYFVSAKGEGMASMKVSGVRETLVSEHDSLQRMIIEGKRGRLEIDRREAGAMPLVYTFCNPDVVKSLSGSKGTITKPSIMLFSADVDYRMGWLNAYGTIPIHKIIQQRKGAATLQVEGRRTRIWLPPQPSTSIPTDGFAVHCDRTMPPRCACVERYEGQDSVLTMRAEVKAWKRVGDAEVPLEILVTTFSRSEDAKVRGKKLMETRMIADEQKSNWMAPVDQVLLDIEFPPGTQVDDAIKKVRYTVGVDNPEPRLNALAKEAKRVQQIDRLGEKMVGAAPVRSDQLLAVAPWWRTPYAYAIYAVLAFAVVLCVYRRRQAAAE